MFPASVELLAAAQGCEFHVGLRSSETLDAVRDCLRQVVPTMVDDRYLHPDIEAATALVTSGAVAELADELLPAI